MIKFLEVKSLTVALTVRHDFMITSAIQSFFLNTMPKVILTISTKSNVFTQRLVLPLVDSHKNALLFTKRPQMIIKVIGFSNARILTQILDLWGTHPAYTHNSYQRIYSMRVTKEIRANFFGRLSVCTSRCIYTSSVHIWFWTHDISFKFYLGLKNYVP